MLIDFETATDISAEYDSIVAGAGPAGITIARKLAEQGRRVALLEGGGRSYSQRSQDIYKGAVSAIDYPLEYTRLRYLGGTSNHWAGRCRPFTELDFEERSDEYALPGWPILKTELDAYLDEAMDILDLPSPMFQVDKPITKEVETSFDPDVALLSPPTRFNQKYSDELEKSKLIDCYYNANLVDIHLSEDHDSADYVIVKSYNGREVRFYGATIILAMGAIENARILLNSNSQNTKGVGNSSDMVGRCFMEHYLVNMGDFIPEAAAWNGGSQMSYFPKPDFVRSNKIGSSNMTLSVSSGTQIYGSRFRTIKTPIINMACDNGFENYLKKVFNFQCAGKGIITTLTEQEPNPESRLTLTDEKDSLGLRRVNLHWSLSDFDKRTIRVLAKETAKVLADNDIGRVKLPDYILDESLPIPVNPHSHHLGTTRMAASAKYGVVDENSRLFDVKNIYVAGSSVFPRGGGNNPTMPLLQLALRLCDHLNSKV